MQKCVFGVCVSHLRAGSITDRRHTLSDVQRCVFVLQLGAAALLARFLPFTPHWMNHTTNHTHLDTHT